MTELQTLLQAAADEAPDTQPDLGAVIRRGRSLRRRSVAVRGVAGVATIMALGCGLAAGVAAVAAHDDRTQLQVAAPPPAPAPQAAAKRDPAAVLAGLTRSYGSVEQTAWGGVLLTDQQGPSALGVSVRVFVTPKMVKGTPMAPTPTSCGAAIATSFGSDWHCANRADGSVVLTLVSKTYTDSRDRGEYENMVTVIRPHDGIVVTLSALNSVEEKSPSGPSRAKPALSLRQLTTLSESDAWLQARTDRPELARKLQEARRHAGAPPIAAKAKQGGK